MKSTDLHEGSLPSSSPEKILSDTCDLDTVEARSDIGKNIASDINQATVVGEPLHAHVQGKLPDIFGRPLWPRPSFP